MSKIVLDVPASEELGCDACREPLLRILVSRRYFHIIGIPVTALPKRVRFRCTGCLRVLDEDEDEATAPYALTARAAKARVNTPWYLFLLPILFAAAAIGGKIERTFF